MILYKPIDYFKPGDIQKLIKLSYQDLFKYFPNERDKLYEQWEKEDKDSFDNLNTIGKHVSFACINDNINPIGYFSWDNSDFPKGVIGQNCVLPDYQNQGYGSNQISFLIKLFEESNFKEITVVTGDHEFFEPARKMYLNCGFHKLRKIKGDLFDIIEYSKKSY